MAVEEEAVVVVTAAVAVTEAVVERVEEVAEATEAVEVAEAVEVLEVVVTLAAVVSCSRLVESCAGAPWLRKHRVRRSAKRPPALRLAYRHALIRAPNVRRRSLEKRGLKRTTGQAVQERSTRWPEAWAGGRKSGPHRKVFLTRAPSERELGSMQGVGWGTVITVHAHVHVHAK